MIKYFKPYLSSFRFKIYLSLFIASIVYLAIIYNHINYTINTLSTRVKVKLNETSNISENSINDAKVIIYGIATSLSSDPFQPLKKDNIYIRQLVDSFLPRYLNIVPKFKNIKIIDSNDFVIFDSNYPKVLLNLENKKNLRIFTIDKQRFFKLNVGNIYTHNEVLLPVCMSMSSKNKYIGAVCANLYVKELVINPNILLSHNITLVNLSNDNSINLKSVEEVLSIKNLLKSYFKKEPLILYQKLDRYDILVRIELDSTYLHKRLKSDMYYQLGYFVFFICLSYCLINFTKLSYRNKLSSLSRKAYELQQKITPNNTVYKELSYDFFPRQLIDTFENIINDFDSLYKKIEIHNRNQSDLQQKDNILTNVLTEHLYYNPKKSRSAYLEQLRYLINETTKNTIFPTFLRETIEYCAEYYSDLNISIKVDRKTYKSFNFKHAALAETIFHIFAMITRIGQFDPDGAILVRTSFNNKNTLPNIYIETIFSNSSLKPIALESGIRYTYSGLLSIYLLAKENNLLFNIEQKKHNFTFVLQAIENNKLKNINNSFLEHTQTSGAT